jgi:hypothetical protein
MLALGIVIGVVAIIYLMIGFLLSVMAIHDGIFSWLLFWPIMLLYVIALIWWNKIKTFK